jgi:hypothetical protein
VKGCSPAITEADRMRYLAFQDIGCICCVIEGHPQTPAEVHHIIQADNQQTLPLCLWHHRGICTQGLNGALATAFYGPSLAVSRRSFEMRYGTEAELLKRVDGMVAQILEREVGHVAYH